MPKFIISFLLSFPLKRFEVIESKNIKTITDKSAVSEKQTSFVDNKRIDIGNVIDYFNITYDLIPEKVKFSADVVVYEFAVKVFTPDGVTVQQSITATNKKWVAFTLNQEFTVTTEELLILHEKYVTFDFIFDKNGAIKKGGKDSTKIYMKDERFRTKNFDRLMPFETIINITDDEESLNLETEENVNHAEYYHQLLMNQTIKNAKEDLFEETPSLETIVDVKKTQKKKIKTKREDETCTIPILGELFFADSFEISAEKSKTFTYIKILIAVEELMTFEQSKDLNPLSITIHSVMNLPYDILKQQGIEEIYTSYNIWNNKTISQKPFKLQRDIAVNDTRTFFTKDISKLDLFEFLQSKQFIVEVRGFRKKVPAAVFGTNVTDFNISKKMDFKTVCTILADAKSDDVLLAVAIFNFYNLLKCRGPMESLHSCYVPFYNDRLNISLLESKKTDYLNNKMKQFRIKRALKANNLLEHGTAVLIKAKLAFNPIMGLIKILNTNTVYNILVLIADPQLSLSVLKSIMTYNGEKYSEDRKSDSKTSTSTSILSEKENWINLTGFAVDIGEESIIFLEGLVYGPIQAIWNQIMNEQEHIKKVFFNSDLIYQYRYYQNQFEDMNDIYTVKLKETLDKILFSKDTYLYREGYSISQKVMLKLDLIRKSTAISQIVKYDLIPSEYEMQMLRKENESDVVDRTYISLEL